MSVALPKAPAMDRESLRDAIREEYQEVAREPGKGFHFHTGRRLAAILGYDESLFAGLIAAAIYLFLSTYICSL